MLKGELSCARENESPIVGLMGYLIVMAADGSKLTSSQRMAKARKVQLDQAIKFLKLMLADGPRSSIEVLAAAKACHISTWRLGYARSKLGIAIAYREHSRGTTMWRLPP